MHLAGYQQTVGNHIKLFELYGSIRSNKQLTDADYDGKCKVLLFYNKEENDTRQVEKVIFGSIIGATCRRGVSEEPIFGGLVYRGGHDVCILSNGERNISLVTVEPIPLSKLCDENVVHSKVKLDSEYLVEFFDLLSSEQRDYLGIEKVEGYKMSFDRLIITRKCVSI